MACVPRGRRRHARPNALHYGFAQGRLPATKLVGAVLTRSRCEELKTLPKNKCTQALWAAGRQRLEVCMFATT